MPEVSIDLNMVRVTNDDFVKKAEACAPKLQETVVKPVSIVDVVKTENIYPDVVVKDSIENLSSYHLAKGDKLCLDFGDHQVGYVTLKLASVGSPQDSPAFFRLKFGEIAKEMTEDSADYDGWISRGWIQEEFIHIDVLPAELKLPRRYAFRYLEIEAIDTSLKWQMVVEDVTCVSVSSVNMDQVKPIKSDDEMIRTLDKVSLRTLMNCMQSVFEDGPKRDRRLWLGDLRLQALANYDTFKNYDLVKRCLYLFAGQTRDDGMVSACLFTEPKFIVDDTFLLDYSMFYGAALLDYYKASGDMETLRDLSKCAYRQMELAGKQFDEKDLLICGEGFWAFIDWTDGLDKQAAMQGVYIYCAKKVREIAEILGDTEKAAELAKEKGAVSISLTNLVDSPLWKACEYPIHYEHGPEADPNDLSKVILYTLAFDMLNVVEPSEKWVKGAESLNNLAEVTERIKAKYADFGSQWGKDYKRETVIYTMGSGANYGEMYSLAICLFMEMQWIHSNCIHSGEYFHGPFEVTDFDVPFVLVKGIGATRELDERAYNFCSKFSQKLAVIDEAEFDLTGIEPGVQEYVAPLLAGTVVREMIDSLAHERGHALSVRRYMWQMEY